MKNLSIILAILILMPFALAIEISAPVEVPENQPFTASISFSNTNFKEAQVLFDGREVASLVFIGSSTGVDYDSTKVVVASYKQPRFNVVFLGTDLGDKTLEVKTLFPSGDTVDETEITINIYDPVAQAEIEIISSNVDKKIDNFKSDVDSTKSELNSKVDESISKVDNLKGELNSLDVKNSELDSEVSNLEGKISDLERNVTTTGGSLTNLEGKVNNLANEKQLTDEEVANLKTKVSGVESDLNVLVEGQSNTPFSGFFTFVGNSALPASVLIVIVVIAILAIVAFNKRQGDEPLFAGQGSDAFSDEPGFDDTHQTSLQDESAYDDYEGDSVYESNNESLNDDYEDEPEHSGKWAYKGSNFDVEVDNSKDVQEKKKGKFNLGALIRRD